MVLHVPFEGFPEAAKAHAGGSVAFVTTMSGQSVVTAGNPASGTIVRSLVPLPLASVKESLQKAGFKVEEGRWSDEAEDPGALWVAAVAYKSQEESPGLWVDTFQAKPTTGQVLAELYEEFRETGDVTDVPLEDFIRQADPNVVILSPEEQAEYARRSHDCE